MLYSHYLGENTRKKWRAKADGCRNILSEQQISLESPGTILKEAEMQIDYVSAEKIVTKGRNGSLPVHVLPELNRKSSFPIQLELKRALLRDYPNIAGLFILLRVMEIFHLKG